MVAVNDSLTIAENAIAAGTVYGGNVLSNDTLDPDAGATTNVSSFSLDVTATVRKTYLRLAHCLLVHQSP
ncbi:MAG: hypothetical protein HT580_09980 [Dechloromonas sp.]|nr:MAG: hypothetical protein HT580_09980 [Dechloromonas sp.]